MGSGNQWQQVFVGEPRAICVLERFKVSMRESYQRINWANKIVVVINSFYTVNLGNIGLFSISG